MINLDEFIGAFASVFTTISNMQPWHITQNLDSILREMISGLDHHFSVSDGIAIHRKAIMEPDVILKPPVIISENCFVASHAYLRGGVFLGKSSSVGPGCE